MHDSSFYPIIAAQGDTGTKRRILEALDQTFDAGIPPSVLMASPYALFFVLRDDLGHQRTVRVDFDALFNFYAEHSSTELTGFTSTNPRLLVRMAHLSYTYLRALHQRPDRSIAYASLTADSSAYY